MKFKYLLRRCTAYLIDMFICFVFILSTQFAVVQLGWNKFAEMDVITDRAGLHNWVLLTVTVPIWLYFSLMEGIKQQTPGKRIFRLKVTMWDRSKMSLGRALFRNFVKLIPWEMNHIVLFCYGDMGNGAVPGFDYGYILVGILTFGYLLCLIVSKESKAPHDFAVGTSVKFGIEGK